jgi:hypothetical protein
MMEETSEAEFEKLLSQLREATQEPDPNLEVVEVDEDEALLDVEDDDVVMLEVAADDVAADAAPSIAVTHKNPLPRQDAPTPSTSEKVNEIIPENISEMSSRYGSGSENASGYQASESGSVGMKLFNYSKYGTRSKIGEGETHFHTEKPCMPSMYYQCKAACAATRNYTTVDVSIGPGAGVSEQIKHSSVGSLDTEILKTFRGSRITANGVTVNQNISSTFDPANLRCVVCPTAHYILAKGTDESPPH